MSIQERRAEYKAQYPLSYADCFALSSAIEHKAVLVTGDPEFKKVEHLVKMFWLPLVRKLEQDLWEVRSHLEGRILREIVSILKVKKKYNLAYGLDRSTKSERAASRRMTIPTRVPRRLKTRSLAEESRVGR